MGKKIKIKVKRGKAKIKLKSGDDVLPISDGSLRGLLGAALASANLEPDPSVRGLLTDSADPASQRAKTSSGETIASPAAKS